MRKFYLYINRLHLIVGFVFYSVEASFAKTAEVNVYFSPNGGCQTAIIREIDKAEKEILIQAYTFTSEPIANALIDAKKEV